MFYVLEAVNIAAILLMLSMLVVVIRQQPSRAQMAFVLYDVFTVIFVIGVQLELMHADTVGEALSGLCVQYVGQAGFLMALLWFASEFAYLKIPGWIYIIQAAINTVVLVGVFTAEHNPYFYNSMKILNDGMYQRINVSGGIIWKMHYIHMAAVLLTIQICCGVRYRQSTATQKKRILYIAAGNGIFALELILKGLGVFGSYNPVVCAMTITMFCMMMAMVKYGYFGSLHAAVDNAFNHGDEGLLVLSNENTIIFVNARMNAMYPGIREGERISKYPDIIEVLKKEDHMLEWGEEIYELRTESIIEHEEKSGMMLWFINQTQQLKQMEELRTANEIKQNILIQISHKLRTPMNAMLGMNEMILRESKEEQVLEYAKETEKAGEQMLALIEKGEPKVSAIIQVIRKYIKICKPIHFDGNGYSDEWKEEAARRGLDCETSVPVIFDNYLKPETIAMFEATGVMTKKELEARNEVKWETYTKKIQIEARVLGDLAMNHIIPVATQYQTDLINNVYKMQSLFPAEKAAKLSAKNLELIEEIADRTAFIKEHVDAMVEARKVANKIESEREKAIAYHDTIAPALEEIRYHIDKLELIVDNQMWTLPKYRELLFTK